MGFAGRIKQHDEEALPLVRAEFERRGFLFFPFGGESVPELQKVLRRFKNGTSRMLRYRPDVVAVHLRKQRSLLLEIKSEKDGSPNFAVEFDAWDALRLWNQADRHVLCVFADLQQQNVFACWPEQLRPQKVFVPRWGDLDRIRVLCPGIPVRYRPTASGSGTAFFLVRKQELKPLGTVLDGWSRTLIDGPSQVG